MNTIATIAAQINSFADKFKLAPEQVEVTSYEQMGPNVRVFYKVDDTYGKSEEDIRRMRQPIRLCNELIPDPFAEDGGTGTTEPEEDIKPTSVTLNLQTTATVGDTVAINPVFLPADAVDKTFTVTAAPEGIVTLINGGTSMICNAPGSVSITITSTVSPSVKVTKVVAVSAAVILPTSLTVEGLPSDIAAGDAWTPTVVLSPVDTTNKEYTLSTTTPAIVKIVGKEVTFLKAGTGNLTATSAAKSTVKSTLSSIVVNPPKPTDVMLNILSDDFTGDTAKVGNTFDVITSVVPAEAVQEVDVTFTPNNLVEVVAGAGYKAIAVGDVTVKVQSRQNPSLVKTSVLKITAA